MKVSLASLLTLAWPIVLARATQSVIGFTDALMVAPLGEEALAAVTTGSLNVFTFIILPMGTVFIVQSFAAQLRGRGELGAIRRYAHYGLLLAALSGVLATVAIPLVPFVLAALEYAPAVERGMGTYLQIRLLSVAAAIGVEALGNWYGGLGNTRPSLVAGVITMLANLGLNYLLIEPRFGLPGWGIAGAAAASVLASWIGFAVLLAGFALDKAHARSANQPRFVWSELVRVLRFGLPNGFNWFLEFAAFALFLNVVVGHLGTTALAAFNVVVQINSVSFMPAFGLASAGAIQVGEAIGRRAFDEVRDIVALTGKVAASWMGSIGVLYFAFPSAILGVFASDDADSRALVEVGATMLALSAIWQLFDAAGITLAESLRAAGDTTWCMTARLVLAWVVWMPLSYVAVFVLEGGIPAVMAAMITYLALLAVLLGYRFLSGRWRDIELVSTQPTVA